MEGALTAGTTVERCDLCGSSSSAAVLESDRLDGPLVRCTDCGLHYVAHRSSSLAFGHGSAHETSGRIVEANAGFPDLPREEERRLNELNAGWRLEQIQSFQASGRLLEVGCGRGDFLRIASACFDVSGVEPNPGLAGDASLAGRVHHGLIEDLPAEASWMDFDVVASFHVIEHVDSPSRFVAAIAERLRPGGTLVLETPDIGSAPFRLLGPRWRQFIPEHYYFFDRMTISRLLGAHGFRIRLLEHVGKHASATLVFNRLGRQIPWLRRIRAMRIPGTVRINPRDVLLAVAAREP